MQSSKADLIAPYLPAQEAGRKPTDKHPAQNLRETYREAKPRGIERNAKTIDKEGVKLKDWKRQKSEKRNQIKQTQQIKYSENIKLATWNCRGINRKTQREQIIEVTKRKRINIMALTETHMSMDCIEE